MFVIWLKVKDLGCSNNTFKFFKFLRIHIWLTPSGYFPVFQQRVGIPMGTNCVPLLADIFHYSYEAEFQRCTTVSFNIDSLPVHAKCSTKPLSIPAFPAKITKMLTTRNSSILMMSSSEYLFWSQNIPSQGMLLRDPTLDICICGYRFWKWRSSES